MCELDGAYSATFALECQSSQANDCPLDPNPGSVTISFTLDTTNFCVEVVDQLTVTASLETYLSSSFAVAKRDFLDGQRAYAQAPAKAAVSMSKTEIVQVSLVRPDNTEIFFLQQGNPVRTADGDTVDLQTVPGAAVAPNEDSLPSFNFLVDSALFGISLDNSAFITLKARIALTYDNAGQAKRSTQDVTFQLSTQELVTAPSGTVSVDMKVAGPSSASSSTATTTVMGVNVLFAGVAVIAVLVLVVAAVVVRRGRAKIRALRERLGKA